jgi:hypothetical protein
MSRGLTLKDTKFPIVKIHSNPYRSSEKSTIFNLSRHNFITEDAPFFRVLYSISLALDS